MPHELATVERGMTTGPNVWFITGSSHGLGRSVAEAALARGERVAATARDARALADLVADHGDQVLALELEVTDPRRTVAAMNATVDTFGRIDVVVDTAGHADINSLESRDPWGVHHMTRAVLPVLRAQRNGDLIQISSIGVAVDEPDGTSTGWGGSSMTIHEVGDDHLGSVRVQWRLLEENGPGTAPREPAELAQAILRVAGARERDPGAACFSP